MKEGIIPVTVTEVKYTHKKTGKPVKMVQEFTGDYNEVECDECGIKRRVKNYRARPDKRYKPENIEIKSEKMRYYIPAVYGKELMTRSME